MSKKPNLETTLVDRAIAAAQNTSSHDDVLKKHQKIADEFEQALDKDFDMGTALSLAGTHLYLSDYLSAVKLVIDGSFHNHEVWVRAEIRAMNGKGGHYYFELAEMDDDENVCASCRATLWRFRAKSVLAKFTAVTGQALSAGASVLIKCSASFHVQYGFSLNITDIDPNYTLGELAAAYQAMKKRLSDEGLLHLNQQLPTPFDIREVIVIAPEKAAGLSDFRAEADRLAAAGACQFHYHYATFQGNQAADGIRHVMVSAVEDFVKLNQMLPDLLVIIRGGGAVGDLAYLNNYELAALVAECPVPVWVGIGHEKDLVILDEVAHTSFDTPSKVILGIESHLSNITRQAKHLMAELIKTTNSHLFTASQYSQRQLERIHRNSTHAINLAKKDTLYHIKHLKSSSKFQSQHQNQHLKSLIDRIKSGSQTAINEAKKDSQWHFDRHKQVFNYIEKIRQNCRNMQSLILIQHPSRILQKGYAIIHETSDRMKVIDHAADLNHGQTVKIHFQDGHAMAVIDDVRLHPEKSTKTRSEQSNEQSSK